MSAELSLLDRAATLLWILTVAAAPAQAFDHEETTPASDDCIVHEEGKGPLCGHAAAQIGRFRSEPSAPQLLRDGNGSSTDITHCQLEIEINPVTKTIAGTNTIDVTALIDGLTQLPLDLQSNMPVDSVRVNTANAGFTRPTNQVLITLDRAYQAGETFQVAVIYHGTPQKIGSGSFEFGTHGSPAKSVVATMSEPWFAHTWWPCKEDLGDKFTADIWITVPDWMTAVSNGLLQGTDLLSGSRKRFRWHEGHLIDVYLVALTATNFSTFSDTYTYAGGSMPVQFYVYPEYLATIQPSVANMVAMLATFSRPDVFGQYPFVDEKYALVEFNWNGGMENQTITSQAFFDDSINSHELSHQWWGDMITCKTWHDIWLNEGFATYSEAIWNEKKPGGSMSAYLSHLSRTRPSSVGYGLTVYCYDISLEDNIFNGETSYYKGAWVLHMLRHVLGDATFFQVLAAYRSAFAGGVADTEDFRGIAESVAGRDLAWFFNEWVYQGGVPSYRFGWKQATIGSQRWVWLMVDQTQTAYPLFTMPIDVTLTTATATDTRSIWQTAARQWYLMPVTAAVTSVKLDNGTWILRPSVSTTTFVNGPPKIIRSTPDLGAKFGPSASVNEVKIQFSEAVSCVATDFSVTGYAGPQAFALSYSAPDYTATLSFPQPLANGQNWTVRVADTVRSVAAGAALDGEIAAATEPASLPSGDGLPGGSSVFTFLVAGVADSDRDGDVDGADLAAWQTCFSGPAMPFVTGCDQRDYDHDGDVDQDDFGILQRCYHGAGQAINPNCAM